MRRLVPIALAALLGCGDRLVGSGYAGEPLATVSGSLVPTPETEVEGPVRLALAWYPQWMAAEDPAGGGTRAPAIVTEDVRAEGTFPVDFRFPVYRPPPAAALARLGEGLAGKGAFGILLAYQDVDGNGRLDPIPEDGAPVDRVVASSLLGDPRSAFALVYVDSPQPGATGLEPGFNLVQAVNAEDAAVVPLDTRVRLALTAGGPLYDAFVCEAGWLTFLLAEVCGLSGGEGGEGPPGFGFDGRVALDGTRLEIELRVTSLDTTYPDANVNVNGRVVPWDAGRSAFWLAEDATTLVRPGGTFIVSATAAGVSAGRVFTMPGEFTVEAPGEWETVSASVPLEVSWTASAGTTTYFAGFEAPPAGYATISEPGALSVLLDTTWAGLGEARAFVEARVDGVDGQAFVTTALVRHRSFYFSE
jgi:hypothetical protein